MCIARLSSACVAYGVHVRGDEGRIWSGLEHFVDVLGAHDDAPVGIGAGFGGVKCDESRIPRFLTAEKTSNMPQQGGGVWIGVDMGDVVK